MIKCRCHQKIHQKKQGDYFMAGVESKSIQVHPALEQIMITNHERFGWTLKSSQEIFSQTAHSDQDSVFVYHYTTTTSFVKLVFSRERDFPNYSRIRELEEQYWACFDTYMSAPKLIPGKWYWIFALALCVPAILFIASGEGGPGSFFGVLPSILIGLAPMLLRHFCYYMPQTKKAGKCLNRCVEIEEEVEGLMKS